MIKIITYKSEHDGVIISHTVPTNPLSGTCADYILLKHYYKSHDVSYMEKDWYKKMIFNTKFLAKHLALHGKITCSFCGEDRLTIYPHDYPKKKYKKFMATADHFHPTSKGGEQYNEANLVPACYYCNVRKGDKIRPLTDLKYLAYHPNQPKNWIKL